MKTATLCLFAAAVLPTFVPVSAQETYGQQIQAFINAREKKLTAENGWLSLAGRFPLKEGRNTIGTGETNDVVFPQELQRTGPEQLGAVIVDSTSKKVILKLASGVTMTSEGKPFTAEHEFTIADDKKDWVTLGRLSFHIIDRGGKYFLRLADNESPVRTKFPGVMWYPPNEAFKVDAKFTPAKLGATLPIVNVLDEESQQPLAGQVEFQLRGETFKLDAIKEGEGLFLIFRDETNGDTTYESGRFIDIDKTPAPGATFTLDFNKAYNPPCAISKFTTCPIPPKQNHLKIKIEAGEQRRRSP